MRLTENQRTTLVHIARISDEFDGYAPVGSGGWRTIRSLERAGLVRWEGPAECGDGCERAGDCPHVVALFTLTEEGERVVRRLDEGTEERAA